MQTQMNKKDLIAIRDFGPFDRNFILATFLRGLYYGNTWFGEIPKNIFMENMHRVLEQRLDQPSVTIKVACLKDDPEVILGYSISRRLTHNQTSIQVLDWCFVKSAWRSIGIGKMLVDPTTQACTNITKTGLSILKYKYPKVIYNPFV